MSSLMKQRRNQRGQGLVETGIILVLFMAIALGLLTFGHAFMVANMITHAARDGARLAAT
jgi:Flp pilus assembly protein TadG